MPDPSLIEQAARAIQRADAFNRPNPWTAQLMSETAIAVVEPLIRADERERIAQAVDSYACVDAVAAEIADMVTVDADMARWTAQRAVGAVLVAVHGERGEKEAP